MTDAQLAQIFTNMSSQSHALQVSVAESAATTVQAAKFVAGTLLAVIVAVTWKG